jgi:TetR/AcrR family transcriptional repressor of nem operon
MYFKLPEPKNTRDLIVFHAFHEMYRVGYSRMSVADLCEKTKLSQDAFLHHFASKDDLAMAVVQEALVKLAVDGWFTYLEENVDPVQGIRKAVERVKNLATEEEFTLGCAYQNFSQELSATDQKFRDVFQNMFNVWVGEIEKALVRGQATEHIRQDIDPYASALRVLSLFFGAIAFGRSMSSRAALDELLEQCVNFTESLAEKKAKLWH